MSITRKQKRLVCGILKFILLGLFLLIVLFPFIWMLLTSLKGSQGEIYAFPVQYLPRPATLKNYIAILWKGNFITYVLNSLKVSISAAALATFVACLSGYVISRFKFRMRTPLMMFFLVTQMIPMFIMIAPLYQMLSTIGALNKTWTLALLYTNMTIPFSVVTLVSFYNGIPSTIEEAAWIDGCSYYRALLYVIVPIMLPGIAATMIFAFVNSWNELFMAVMFIDKDQFKTITVGLNSLIGKYDVNWGEMAAGTIISLVPTMFLFAIGQKYMIEGLTSGSVKG